MPERPLWGGSDTIEELDRREKAAFDGWLRDLERGGACDTDGGVLPPLNNFERSLEVWRELWRVLEISQVLLHIVDARMPLLHFAAPVYEQACRQSVPLVVLLNKADLVPAEECQLWREYLQRRFPDIRAIIPLTADSQLRGARRWSQGRDAAAKILEAIKACPVLHEGIRRPAADFFACGEEEVVQAEDHPAPTGGDSRPPEVPHRPRDYITLGFIGEPNMGKSSAINLILGASKVGVGPTPGKTKHLQTHYLCPRVRLCDCPGLVFPKRGVPAGLQALSGNFPISQVREPYSTLRFLEENGALPSLEEAYKLEHPEEHDYAEKSAGCGEAEWSPYGIAEALAVKLNFFAARGGRPDAARAANRILRDVLDGNSVILAFKPPPDPPFLGSLPLA